MAGRGRGPLQPVFVRRALDPVAAQALGRHRGGDLEEKACAGRPEEVGALRTLPGGARALSLRATRRLRPHGGPGQVFVLSAKIILTVGHLFADPATLNQSAPP